MLKTVEVTSNCERITLDTATGILFHWFHDGQRWWICDRCGDLPGGLPHNAPIYHVDIVRKHCSEYRATLFPLKGATGERYKTGANIGKGGFGIVRKGMTRSGFNVAIKKILQGNSGTEKVRNWQKELSVLVNLNHPNIIRLYDAMTDGGGGCYLVYELAQENLLEYIRRDGPQDDETCLFVAKGLLSALEHMHAKGIIHRDVKPQNILVSMDGICKIADLGIARLLDPWREFTTTLIGTPAYCPPELLNGAGSRRQSDLYQLGLVLFYLRTGVCPIDERQPRRVIDNAILHAVPRIAAERMNCSPKLRTLISTLLRRTLHLRFQSAKDVLFYLNYDALPPNTRIA